MKPKLVEVENQRYEVLSEGLDELISEQLIEKEAKARNVTAEQLDGHGDHGEGAGADRRRDPEGLRRQQGAARQAQTLDQVKPRIVEFLKQQKAASGRRRSSTS